MILRNLISLSIVVIFAVFATGTSDSGSRSQSSPSAPTDKKAEAVVYCEDAVKQRLKAPSSAEFAGSWMTKTEYVTDLGGGLYRMRSYVDAQNSFGAKIRSNFICEIEFDTQGGWKINRLEIE